jgi:hypothetical protein
MKASHLIFIAALILLTSCNSPKAPEELYNNAAAFPASFKLDNHHLKVITSSINKKLGTMSTLYGNEPALSASRTGVSGTTAEETFELVTWQQQADEHWFGAKIPANLTSVEYVTVGTNQAVHYQRYEGTQLTLVKDTLNAAERTAYIFKQKASIMP